LFKTNKRLESLEKNIEDLGLQLTELKNTETNLQLQVENRELTLHIPEKKEIIHPEDKEKAVYALNLCLVSISQIIDYSDINVLEQEYDSILNNVNLENIIKDDVMLNVFDKILDVITYFKVAEGQKKILDLEYQQKMKNAIWSAVPNIGILFAGGNALTLAISLASQVGCGYMNYRKAKANNELDKLKKDWELEKNAIEQLNGLRRELFNASWHLAEKYGYTEEKRLTEKQITNFNEILMDPDPLRKYQRLLYIKQSFTAYPPFWYYLGNAANSIAQDALSNYRLLGKNKSVDKALLKEIEEKMSEYKRISDEYKNKAINHFKTFFYINGDTENEQEFKVNKGTDGKLINGRTILREDIIAASCALEAVELLEAKEKATIKDLLDVAKKYAPNDNDILELCALNYLKIEGGQQKAAELFKHLVNQHYNEIVNVQLLSRIEVTNYLQDKDNKHKSEYIFLADRINNNYLYPWTESKKELEASNQLFLDRQKAILAKKVLSMLSEIRLKHMVNFNKIIPVSKPGLYYDEEYFYDYENSINRRKDSITKILETKKEGRKYFDEQFAAVPFGLKVLEIMQSLMSDLAGISGYYDDENSFFDKNIIMEIKNDIEEKLLKKRDLIIENYKYFDECRFDPHVQFFEKDDADKPPKKFDMEKVDDILSITFSEFTEDGFKIFIEGLYNFIKDVDSMEELSKADEYISNWARKNGIKLDTESIYKVISVNKTETDEFFSSDLFGTYYITDKDRIARKSECQKIIRNYFVVNDSQAVQLYEVGTTSFRKYISKLSKKDKIRLKSDMDNIFIIIKTSFLSTDLILSLDGIYVKNVISGIVAFGEYSGNDKIDWYDENNTKINIGGYSYSNKNLDISALLKGIKEIEALDMKKDNSSFKKELSDDRFKSLFSKLHAISYSAKLFLE